MSYGNEMICQQGTLSGYAEWPKVADAMIKAVIAMARYIAMAVNSAGGGGAGTSGGVITATMVFLEEKGCVSWDISAAPRRSGREYYGNEPK